MKGTLTTFILVNACCLLAACSQSAPSDHVEFVNSDNFIIRKEKSALTIIAIHNLEEEVLTADTFLLTLKDGEYFDALGRLFLSTKRDTTIKIVDAGHIHKRKIGNYDCYGKIYFTALCKSPENDTIDLDKKETKKGNYKEMQMARHALCELCFYYDQNYQLSQIAHNCLHHYHQQLQK